MLSLGFWEPVATFTDDPLRMLRACRFAAKLGFEIAPETYAALKANAFRLSPEHGISFAYVMNQMEQSLLPNDKSLRLVGAIYSEGHSITRRRIGTPKSQQSRSNTRPRSETFKSSIRRRSKICRNSSMI